MLGGSVGGVRGGGGGQIRRAQDRSQRGLDQFFFPPLPSCDRDTALKRVESVTKAIWTEGRHLYHAFGLGYKIIFHLSFISQVCDLVFYDKDKNNTCSECNVGSTELLGMKSDKDCRI